MTINYQETSREAHESIQGTATSQRERMLWAFCFAGDNGLTDEQAAAQVGILDTCYWARGNDLRELGWIERTPEKRPGRSGRRRFVNRITPEGRIHLSVA